MPYRFLEKVATADVAFEAWGSTIEEMFVEAAEATLNVMVADLSAISRREKITLVLENDSIEMLLFDFLGELVYLKDAQRLLLLVENISVKKDVGGYELAVTLAGEKINPKRHPLNVDVKGVTLHLFEVAKTASGWQATVVLDI
ncbi:protein archease [Geobacter sp. OR-1]|uniref:archease n=1 Tax=Geobacter sp. OR-1 TaxID=1266765 RepID=UPI0005437352|nr:archease [Geobacter sp. OR-1]GAM09560.1 protein archease [Geobacter sp. OR-1]